VTRRPIPAAIAAGGVVAFALAAGLVQAILQWVSYGHLLSEHFWIDKLAAFGIVLVAGLGIFLVLWLLIPIAATSTTRQAIGAGIVAAVGGAVLMVVVDLLVKLGFAREASGSLYDLIPLDLEPGRLISSVVSGLVTLLPLTVLAAVLVREWLRLRAAVDAPKEPVPAV
jgi:hypothetical protein